MNIPKQSKASSKHLQTTHFPNFPHFFYMFSTWHRSNFNWKKNSLNPQVFNQKIWNWHKKKVKRSYQKLGYLFPSRRKSLKCGSPSFPSPLNPTILKQIVVIPKTPPFLMSDTVAGSEIPRPTTGWMFLKPYKYQDKLPTSTGDFSHQQHFLDKKNNLWTTRRAKMLSPLNSLPLIIEVCIWRGFQWFKCWVVYVRNPRIRMNKKRCLEKLHQLRLVASKEGMYFQSNPTGLSDIFHQRQQVIGKNWEKHVSLMSAWVLVVGLKKSPTVSGTLLQIVPTTSWWWILGQHIRVYLERLSGSCIWHGSLWVEMSGSTQWNFCPKRMRQEKITHHPTETFSKKKWCFI